MAKNPTALFFLNLFTLGTVGYLVLGQQGKAIKSLLYTVVTLGVFVWLAAMDAARLGAKAQAGEAIGETENGLALMDRLPGFK